MHGLMLPTGARDFLICNYLSGLLFPGIKAVPNIQKEADLFSICERKSLSVLSGRKWTIGEDNPVSTHVNIGFTLLSIWMRQFKYSNTLRLSLKHYLNILWQLKCKPAHPIS